MALIGRIFAGAFICAASLGGMYVALDRVGPAEVGQPGTASPGTTDRIADADDASAKPRGEAETKSASGSTAQSDRGVEASRPDVNASGAGHPDNAGLRMNAAGLEIIKQSEGLRLEAYPSGSGWLIGYGHARTAREGMVISQAQAEALLREDVRDSENGLKKIITVPVNENQFSAMVSLAYNLGLGGFRKTAVFERINAGDYAGAADGFLRHDRARINGEMQTIPHLTERRHKERALFLTPV